MDVALKIIVLFTIGYIIGVIIRKGNNDQL